jgi:hypothetical protein
MKLSDLNIGSVVKVADAWGSGPILVGTVIELDPDIKNGLPGISYELADGEGKWAYLDQVRAIIKK